MSGSPGRATRSAFAAKSHQSLSRIGRTALTSNPVSDRLCQRLGAVKYGRYRHGGMTRTRSLA